MRISPFRILAGCLLTVLAILVVGAAWLLSDKSAIEERLVEALNKRIETPIAGDFHLSLLQSFPRVGLIGNDVEIAGSQGLNDRPLLRAGQLQLQIQLWEIIQGTFRIDRVVLEDAVITLREADGRTNYRVVAEKGDSTQGVFSITEARLKNVQLHYLRSHGDREKEMRWHIQRGLLAGSVQGDAFECTFQAKGKAGDLWFDEPGWIAGHPFMTSFALRYDPESKSLAIAEGNLEAKHNQLDFKGRVDLSTDQPAVQLHVQASGDKIAKLVALLPARERQHLDALRGSGAYFLQAAVSGDLNAGPDIDLSFALSEGQLRLADRGAQMQGVNLRGTWSRKLGRADRIEIPGFELQLNGAPLSGSLSIIDPKRPTFEASLHGTIALDRLQAALDEDELSALEGHIRLQGFDVKGTRVDLKNIQHAAIEAKGQVGFEKVGLVFRQVAYKHINGKLRFADQEIHTEGLRMQFANTDVEFTGRLQNLFPYLFNLGANQSSAGTVLGVQGTLRAQLIDLKQLLGSYTSRSGADSAPEQAVTLAQIQNMRGVLNTHIERFEHGDLELESVDAQFELKPRSIRLREFTCLGMQGNLEADGDMNFPKGNNVRMDINARLNQVDIEQLFDQCGNFGQQTLRSNNLAGKLQSDVHFRVAWDNLSDFVEESLEADASVTIHKGELIEFKPVLALSKFVQVEELQRIRFSTLTNSISIRNGSIRIPEMLIESSVLDLALQGTHGFDNSVDYRINLGLRDLLAKKFRNGKHGRDETVVTPEGGARVFLSMTGKMSDPVVRYDKLAVKAKIKQDLQDEKAELKQLFGKAPNPVTPDPKRIKRLEQRHFMDEGDEFIEWESDSIGQQQQR